MSEDSNEISTSKDETIEPNRKTEINRDKSPQPIPSCSYPVRREYYGKKPLVFRLHSSSSIVNASFREAKKRANKEKRQSFCQCHTSMPILNAKNYEAKRKVTRKKRSFCQCKKRRLEHKDSLELKRHSSSRTSQNDKCNKDNRRMKSRHSER